MHNSVHLTEEKDKIDLTMTPKFSHFQSTGFNKLAFSPFCCYSWSFYSFLCL